MKRTLFAMAAALALLGSSIGEPRISDDTARVAGVQSTDFSRAFDHGKPPAKAGTLNACCITSLTSP
jgi:hypothetical protein